MKEHSTHQSVNLHEGNTVRARSLSRRLRSAVAAVLVPLSACGWPALAVQGSPIVVASISSLEGAEASPESIAAARAYFDLVNATGGIQGRHIEYRVIDDKMDPELARKAVTQLVKDTRVVALAGGSSVLACGVIAETLAQADLYDIPGGAVDTACFQSSHIMPVNAGPYASTYNAMTFARQALKKTHLCAVVPQIPGEPDDYVPTATQWHKQHGGAKPAFFRYEVDAPLSNLAASAALAPCEAVVFVGPEGAGIAWVKVFRARSPKTPIILMTTSYASRTMNELAGMGDGIYSMAEFDPWSDRSLSSIDWRQLMLKSKLPLSSLSQGGYLAAQLLVKQLLTIRGSITRASVSEALRAMPAWNSGMTHRPLKVDARGHHELNRSGLPMQLQNGRWQIAHSSWVTR